MNYPTGALKDKRKPDELVRFYAPKAVERPRRGGWSNYNPYPFNQDGKSMCVGVADAELMANDAARLGIIPTGKPLFYSPWYIYNWARFMRGWLNEDNGSYPEDAAQAICEHGVLRYDRMPCKRDEFGNIAMNTADPSTFEPYASKYPNIVKARIDNGVQGILAALADGVVSIAVPWFDKWGSSYKAGPLPPIADQEISGRHNILFDDWDEDEGMFYFPNSWGEWGIQEAVASERPFRCGGKMPFEYIELFKSKFGGYDAWDLDFNPADPEPPMVFYLSAKAAEGGYGTGDYAAGSKAEIYAGKKIGFEFSSWKPGLNVANPFSASTKVLMLDDAEINAYFKANKAKRCDLFAQARKIMQEGI